MTNNQNRNIQICGFSITNLIIVICVIVILGSLVNIFFGNVLFREKPKGLLKISAGSNYTCAISINKKSYCWGTNGGRSGLSSKGDGRLGNNSNADSLVPVSVDTSGVLNGKTIKSITTGYSHTCAIASDDLAYCWGDNGNGRLGNNTTVNSLVPVAVDTSGALNGKTIKAITNGRYHTCVIASDNRAYCWGRNWYGQLGNNTFDEGDHQTPTAVSLLGNKTVKSISAGDKHTCAIGSDNLAYCWGDEIPSINYPVDNSSALKGKTIKAISAGDDHTCVIASDDQAYCWGDSTYGALGSKSPNGYIPVAVDTSGVLNGKTIKSITAGENFTCAIASDNRAYCWGANNWSHNAFGMLGNNSGENSDTPVAVDTSGVLNGKTIKSITAGMTHACVIDSENQAYCWGYNFGALGNNDEKNSFVPVKVSTK